MHGGGMLVGMANVRLRFERPPTKTGVVATSAAFGAGFVGGLAAWAVGHLADFNPAFGDALHSPKLYACLAFPMLMGVFLLSGTLLVGSTSYVTQDEDREWWARAGGWFMAIAIGWLAFALVVLYSVDALDWLDAKASAAFTALTGLTGFAAARGGKSSKTGSGRHETDSPDVSSAAVKMATEYGTKLLLPVFVLLLVMLLSGLNLRIL